MKTRFIAIITLAMLGATFVGCASEKTATNLGRAIDGNGNNTGTYYGTTDLTDGKGTDYYGITDGYYDNYSDGNNDYNAAYGTGYNGGVSGTMYGDDSGYSTYMNNSYRQGGIQNDMGTEYGRMYNEVYGN